MKKFKEFLLSESSKVTVTDVNGKPLSRPDMEDFYTDYPEMRPQEEKDTFRERETRDAERHGSDNPERISKENYVMIGQGEIDLDGNPTFHAKENFKKDSRGNYIKYSPKTKEQYPETLDADPDAPPPRAWDPGGLA
jgi:hypothetical protein